MKRMKNMKELKKILDQIEAKVEPIKWSETRYRPMNDVVKIGADSEETLRKIKKIFDKKS